MTTNNNFQKDIDKATAQLTRMDRVIQDNLQPAARAAAGTLKAEAIRRAPILSGKLKRSFGDRPGESSEKTAVYSGVHVVFNRAFYAPAVESGRYKRPFMRPAARAAKADMLQAMGTTIKRAVDRTL